MAAPSLIPKEQLSAYERWELDSFDRPGAAGPVSLTTAAQVEKIHQQAQRDGYQAGYAEGRKRAAAEAEGLAALATALSREGASLDQELAQQLLDLALDIARQMLGCALAVKPALVLPLVQEAIRSLPVLGEGRRLRLHPQDAALVREAAGASLQASGWAIVEDAAISRGGCIVSSSHGEVDATPEARWRRILAALGRDGAWLADEPAAAEASP